MLRVDTMHPSVVGSGASRHLCAHCHAYAASQPLPAAARKCQTIFRGRTPAYRRTIAGDGRSVSQSRSQILTFLLLNRYHFLPFPRRHLVRNRQPFQPFTATISRLLRLWFAQILTPCVHQNLEQ